MKDINWNSEAGIIMKGNETINYRGAIVQQIEFSVIKNVFLTSKKQL